MQTERDISATYSYSLVRMHPRIFALHPTLVSFCVSVHLYLCRPVYLFIHYARFFFFIYNCFPYFSTLISSLKNNKLDMQNVQAELAQWIQRRAANWTAGIRFPQRGKLFLSTPQRQERAWVPLSLLSLSLGVQRPRHEADQSLPSCAQVKNGGTIPPLPHTSSWYSA
jgi:hypothetical protein